jgi:tetratricopeptide (TPR) repeat protein
LRSANDRRIYLASAAVSAGLLASVVHSLADFVWYIPSLMAITVLLIACAYRLAEWSVAAKKPAAQLSARRHVAWAPLQCGLAAMSVALVGSWMIYDRFCATMAEPNWDQYLTYALDTRLDKKAAEPSAIKHLESVLHWTPDNAKAHIRLANLLVTRFELLQRESANVMPLQQVCEAAFDSRDYFHSREELDAWLDRAIGEHRKLLDLALWHLHRGLAQNALMGEGYIHLSDLCFLEGASRPVKTAYLEQALKVRPNDGVVLLAAGSAAALRQDAETVLKYWRPVLRCREEERRAMARLLVSTQLPLEFVLEQFQPDLPATRLLYEQYSPLVPPEALQPLLAYYGQSLQQKIRLLDAEGAAPLWLELHSVFGQLHRPQQAIECLQHAIAARPSDFDIRYALGRELCSQGDFVAAEPHLRWCVARQPNNTQINQDLAQAVKGRIDQQSGVTATARVQSPNQSAWK